MTALVPELTAIDGPVVLDGAAEIGRDAESAWGQQPAVMHTVSKALRECVSSERWRM
jgi:hypothetical protein